MKKYLIIAGVTIGGMTAIPAYAVTKCVPLGGEIKYGACENHTMVSFGTAGSADWSATCEIGTETVDLSGVAVCAQDKSGLNGTALDTISVSTTETDNKYCWCKMTSPAVSQWINVAYGTTTLSNTRCTTACAVNCADFLTNSSVYKAMFSNLSD